MKKCHYCSFENKDAARFCVKCGKDLEKRCPQCGCVLSEEGETYCPGCGARLDGKIGCLRCGAENDGDSEFCEQCGAPLKAAEPPQRTRGANPYAAARGSAPAAESFAAQRAVPRPPREKKSARQLVDRILDIARASVILVFSAVMFIMSFMSVSHISAPPEMSDGLSNQPGMDIGLEIISVDVSSLDVIEGAFLRIDPKSEEEIVKNFLSYITTHLSKKDQAFLDEAMNSRDPSVSDTMRLLEIFTGVVEDYNVLQFLSGKKTVELTPAATMELGVSAAMSFIYIGISFAFFIAALVDFIYTLTGRKRTKASFLLGGLSLAVAIGLAFTLKVMLGGAAGAGLITFIVFAVLSLATEAGYRIFAGEGRFTLAKLPRYISAGVGAALAVVLLFLCSSSLIKVVCEYTAGTSAASPFRAGYNASELAMAWDSLKQLEMNSELLGSAETYFPRIFTSSGSIWSSGLLLEQALSPAMMGVVGKTSNVENVLAIIGPVLEGVCIALFVVLALSIADRVKAISEDRDAKMAYGIVGFCLVAVVLALTIAYTLLVNTTLDGVQGVTYTTDVSGILITAAVFALVELVQRIVCRALTKEKETPEDTYRAEEEETACGA